MLIKDTTFNNQDHIGPDGTAIFYRKDMFEHVKSFHTVLDNEKKEPSNSTVVVCQLEHRLTAKRLTVLATHLKVSLAW